MCLHIAQVHDSGKSLDECRKTNLQWEIQVKTAAFCLETSDLMKRKYQVGSIPSDWNISCLGSLANLSVTS